MRILLVIILVILIASLVAGGITMIGCGDDETKEPTETAPPTETAEPTATVVPPSEPVEEVTITIGNLSDLTGPAAAAISVVDMALEDLVKYFNEEKLIPGVKLKTVTYDTAYDPSKSLPGYHWLRDKGADVVVTGLPPVGIVLKSQVDKDEFVMFTISTDEAMLDPPGYIFSMAAPTRKISLTLANWIAENDWDYEVKGPAKVGAVGWNAPYPEQLAAGFEEYAEAHPERFTWEGTYLQDMGAMQWGAAVEGLKNCDYVMAPATGLSTIGFIKEYADAGGKGKFLGTDAHSSFLGMIISSVGWDTVDGLIAALPIRWWNEEAELPDLCNKLCNEYHSDSEIENIHYGGYSYLGALSQYHPCLLVIKETVARVGAENVNSQEIYKTATSFSHTYDGMKEWNFTGSKRSVVNHLGIYEYNAEVQDIIRKDAEWQPVLSEP